MTGEFAELLTQLPASAIGSIHVRPWPGRPGYYAGRDQDGCAALLIRATGGGLSVPMGLAGLTASFDVSCTVKEPGAATRSERLTTITCRATEPAVEGYFAGIVELLVEMIGSAPTAVQVATAVSHLVDLFQKLRRPARKPLLGLIGELMVIYAAQDPVSAAAAWRSDSAERYDFAVDDFRLEAKASSGRQRVHSLSLEQSEPPVGTLGFLASINIEHMAGGTSVSDLLRHIETRILNHTQAIRIRSIVADTMGQDLTAAMAWKFDKAQATASLAFFDLREIPAIRGPVPPGVASVRFTSDLSSTRPVGPGTLRTLSSAQKRILPASLVSRH